MLQLQNSFLTAEYAGKSNPDQEFRQYELLKDSRVHLFEFNQVDTTMRIADEFEHKDAYTRALAALERSSR